MASYYTRILRIYGVNNSIPIEQICSSIKSTALFEHELIWNMNEEENHLDIKWNSKKGAGELGINFQKYFIWEIKANEYNEIYFYNRNETPTKFKQKQNFNFDSISINSSNQFINEKYLKDLFSKGIDYKIINESIKIKGSYKSNCGYEIGEIDPENLSPIKHQNINQFLEPRGEFIMINEFNDDFNGHEKLNEFLKLITLYWKSDEYEIFEGFNNLVFKWKGRIVNTIVRGQYSYDMWKGQNSDWWDNCNLPAWKKFKNDLIELKTHDNNR